MSFIPTFKAAGAALKVNESSGAAGDNEQSPLANLLPQPLRLKYNVGKIIGDGNFAVVRICKDRTSGKDYALKIIDKAKCKGKEHYVEAEKAVPPSHRGDLFDSITQASKFSEPQSRLLISHLTSAIAYLHSLSIVHRDIKPENLL
ncbi:unnamed protein product [Leptidea sinapis]|uniref:Protein kinase domain-containing protein n=1 Tax=Leptidea sinapis TaxID=189913 RepID=A0A5E4Q2Y2_9NEOP|nr:unnamed protein product [Leptidea sinapis]